MGVFGFIYEHVHACMHCGHVQVGRGCMVGLGRGSAHVSLCEGERRFSLKLIASWLYPKG